MSSKSRCVKLIVMITAAVAMMMALFTAVVFADEYSDAEVINVGDEKEIVLSKDAPVKAFKFTPSQNGTYMFASTVMSEDPDARVEVFTPGEEVPVYIDGQIQNGKLQIGFNGKTGTTYYLIMEYTEWLQKPVSTTISLKKLDVKGITFSPADPLRLVEKVDGFESEDEKGRSYFEYTPFLCNGDKLTVENGDGSLVEYLFDSDISEYVNKDDTSDTILSVNISMSDNQATNHWTVGNTYSFTVECFGFESVTPVEIIKNPYMHMTFTPKDPYQIVKYTNGEWLEDENLHKFYYYDDPEFAEGDIIQMMKEDLTTAEYVYDPSKKAFINKDDPADKIVKERVSFETDQADKHWVVGTDNSMTITCFGFQQKVQVEILDSEEPDPEPEPEEKKKQPMKVKASGKKTYKAAALRKAKKTFKAVTVKNARGKVTYKVTGNKKSKKALKFAAKTGKVTVKKSTKKGTYKLKIKVKAAGNSTYAAGTKTVTVTVKVK